MVESGFSVDVDEIEALARKYRELADDVSGHNCWKYDVDTGRWPADDPLRDAVEVYERGLRGAVDRLCGGSERIGALLLETAAHYRDMEKAAEGHLRNSEAVAPGGGDRLGRAAG